MGIHGDYNGTLFVDQICTKYSEGFESAFPEYPLIWFEFSKQIIGHGFLRWSKAQTRVEKRGFVEAYRIDFSSAFFNVGLNTFPKLQS